MDLFAEGLYAKVNKKKQILTRIKNSCIFYENTFLRSKNINEIVIKSKNVVLGTRNLMSPVSKETKLHVDDNEN